MKFLTSLDPKDRKLLMGSLGVALALAVLIGMLLPNSNITTIRCLQPISRAAWRARGLRDAARCELSD